MNRATGWFEVSAFEEKPVAEVPGLPKLGRVSLTLRFFRDLAGEAASQSVLAYGAVSGKSASATFAGMDRFTGSLDGREGSFVLQSSGSFDVATGEAFCAWRIVAGSGGGLAVISGAGE